MARQGTAPRLRRGRKFEASALHTFPRDLPSLALAKRAAGGSGGAGLTAAAAGTVPSRGAAGDQRPRLAASLGGGGSRTLSSSYVSVESSGSLIHGRKSSSDTVGPAWRLRRMGEGGGWPKAAAAPAPRRSVAATARTAAPRTSGDCISAPVPSQAKPASRSTSSSSCLKLLNGELSRAARVSSRSD